MRHFGCGAGRASPIRIQVTSETGKMAAQIAKPGELLLQGLRGTLVHEDLRELHMIPDGGLLMSRRVLLIEDNALARFAMLEILEDAGFEVEDASSGDQGIALHHKKPFELVVTDIVMPKKDGLDTIRELKEAFPSLPIIAVSGGGRNRDVDSLEAARKAGADRVLRKPFTRQELVEIVTSLLEG
ncbi:MAG TPA: response regulator [bacterium]